MRNFLLIALSAVILCPEPARSNDNFMQMDGMTFTGGLYGHGTNRRGWRIAPRWAWGVEWLKQSPVRVTGYWEGGLGHWEAFQHHVGGNDSVWIVSGSEIFQFWLGPVDKTRNALFLEFGIGPGYLTADKLGSRNFGGHWQFEDKFGAGVNFGTTRPLQLIYRYYHYSNAGFQPPNNGLDLHTLGFVCFF